MIGQDKQKSVVDAKEIFRKLLEPLFATAYKSLQVCIYFFMINYLECSITGSHNYSNYYSNKIGKGLQKISQKVCKKCNEVYR